MLNIKSLFINDLRRSLALTISLFVIVCTSGIPKFSHNTSLWPWGVYWHSNDEIKGYVWLRKNLPANTKVFSFTDNLLVIGHDMRADYWSETYKSNFKNVMDANPNHKMNLM